MKYKGIIFDFNGVLFWDSHLHEEAWHIVAPQLRGFPLSSEEIFTYVLGKTNKSILEYLLHRPVVGEELQKLASHKETIYQNLCLKDPKVFQLSPGGTDLLEFLVENKIPHTIATASPKGNLDFFVQHLHLAKWFEIEKIVYDDGTFTCKQEMYVKAAKNINLSPEQCIVIEDSKAGMIAAAKAKIGKIVALGPAESHQILREIEGVSEAISSLDQIAKEKMFIDSFLAV